MQPSPANLPDLPAYLNGEYTVLSQAKVSVMDRGFIFGDGVYDVLPVYAGQPFRFDQHMARLERGLRELRIANPMSRQEWLSIATKLIANYDRGCWTNGLFHPKKSDSPENSAKAVLDTPSDQLIYIQVTRGVAMRNHVMPEDITPTVFVMTNAMKMPSAEQRAQGVACVTAQDFRWEKAHIKATSLLGAVFSRQISADVGAEETIMFRGDLLSEAAACNVWIVKNGKLLGPKKNHLVLEGIRYSLFESLCADQGLGFELRDITRAEVLDADEVLLSSATKEVLAVTSLDGQPVGHGATLGRPGPVCAQLLNAYQTAKASAAPAPQASLIEYPCTFPIKVMGLQVDGFVQAMCTVARAFDPAFDEASLELRASSGGKYQGVTLTVLATSREQLDELYRTLSSHPMVRVVL